MLSSPQHPATLRAHERRQAASLDAGALGKIALFDNLLPEQLSQLNRFFRYKTCPAGATLITAEQAGERAYIVLEGTVKVHVEQADGRNVILSILGPGQIVGEMSLADSLDCSATVVTLEESRLLWIDRDHFRECLCAIPQLQSNIIRILAARLRLANAHIQSLAALKAPRRVARQLLAFAKEYGRAGANGDMLIPIRLTQDDLADLVGTSRVHVNRVLADYKRCGVLSVDQRHYITVHNVEELVRRCE